MAKIIAELCQNHNGDISLLNKMIKEAAEAGVDYIKIQSCLSKDLTRRERFENGVIEDKVIKTIKRPYKEEYNRLKNLDLTDEDHFNFIEECKKYNVKPLTTVFNTNRIPFLASLPWPEKSIKVASFDCRSLPLLKKLVEHGFEKIFISTGTTYDKEIEETSRFLDSFGVDYTFLHCVSIYPTSIEDAHLDRINYLGNFSNKVGFSEHSSYDKAGLDLSLGALTYGVDVIERHFTSISKDLTKDGLVSLNYEQMKELVSYSKLNRNEIMEILGKEKLETMKGFSNRELTHTEILNRDYYQGRFANINEDGTVTYNWEKEN